MEKLYVSNQYGMSLNFNINSTDASTNWKLYFFQQKNNISGNNRRDQNSGVAEIGLYLASPQCHDVVRNVWTFDAENAVYMMYWGTYMYSTDRD